MKRRVAALETQNFGRVRRYRSWPLLQALYVDACTGRVHPTEMTATSWAASVSLLDEEMLLEIARASGDPFPWRCFLLVMDRFTFHGFNMELATDHLLEMARNMLDMQGLSKVQPEDLLHLESNPFASYQYMR